MQAEDSEADADVRRAALSHAAQAIKALGQIVEKGVPDSARLGAAREILDRAFGKSPSAEQAAPAGPVSVVIRRFSDEAQDV